MNALLRPPKFLAWAALALAAPVLGCSADAVTAPEPGVETPGAFVAVESDQGIRLFRVVGRGALGDGDALMVLILYAARPASFSEARELARRPQLAEEVHQYFYEESRIRARPHEVVWFRTLTAQETAPETP
ncbi:MAG TPA: hypothetical protein VGK73_28140 [Polyangiaceae bacterium]